MYYGERYIERYDILRTLCLTHQEILPFAQEELFKRLDISSDRRKTLLNASIASSDRCREYAGRAESILLGEDVDPDKLSESGVFNPRELCSVPTLKVSFLSRSCIYHGIPVALTSM